MTEPYKVGERVSRLVDVYNSRSRLLTGTITKVYGRHSYFGWYDPELYEVLWDDGITQRGYFRHGLMRIE